MKSLPICAAIAAFTTIAFARYQSTSTSPLLNSQQQDSTQPKLAQLAAKTPPDGDRNDAAAWERYRKTADRHTPIGIALASRALTYRGVPYRFGGTGQRGIDCSALTQAVYRKWGMLLPRTSIEQFKKGIRVLRAGLKPGDLVFFANTYRYGISHVGIYVGDGKIVHAAGRHQGVIVSSLDEPYLLHHYAGARRIALDKESPLPPAPEDVAVEQ